MSNDVMIYKTYIAGYVKFNLPSSNFAENNMHLQGLSFKMNIDLPFQGQTEAKYFKA
jgi:hypothetical protein